jgi:glycosyltransferase involved in cell wall biosynthesis
MKIARLTPHFYWPQLHKSGWPVKFDAIGGMQTQIYRLALALEKAGIEQQIYTLKIPGAPRNWTMSTITSVFGVRVPIFPFVSKVRGMVDLNLSWALGVCIKLIPRIRDISIIHVHCSGVFWPPLLGFALCYFTKKPLVLTIHCSILNTYHSMCWLDEVLLPFARWCEKRALKHAHHTILLTDLSRSKLLRLGIVDESQASVVPDGINVENFRGLIARNTRQALRAQYGIPENSIVIGYVGRIAREKGWPTLIKLMGLLPNNFFLLVCGDGNERNEMADSLAQAGHNSRSCITGYVSQSEIPSHYGALDLLVLPSQHEEFGGTLLEAMAAEVPIVAFAVGGVPSVLDGGKCGLLVEAQDINGLANSVTRICSNPDFRASLVMSALKRVRSEYDIENAAAKLIEIYKSVGSSKN